MKALSPQFLVSSYWFADRGAFPERVDGSVTLPRQALKQQRRALGKRRNPSIDVMFGFATRTNFHVFGIPEKVGISTIDYLADHQVGDGAEP